MSDDDPDDPRPLATVVDLAAVRLQRMLDRMLEETKGQWKEPRFIVDELQPDAPEAGWFTTPDGPTEGD